MFKYILTASLVLLTVFLFAGKIYAFQNLSIRIGQPKTPTNQSSFELVFVTLDTKGRTITVKCFKKGPNDSSFSQFGSDIAIQAGGDTQTCHADSSILNTRGTYQFFASAAADSEIATSQTNTVDFNNSDSPGAPTEFSKNKITSCEYKISYKTSDDGGKTVKVELYRSDNQQFSADSGTRVGSRSIGSNTADSFNDIVSDCGKTYYHAIRAFDKFGNGSGLAGEASVTITTEIAGSAETNTATTPSESAGGAIPITGSVNANILGETAGEEEKSESRQTSEEESPSSKTQEVKGEAQKISVEKAKEGFFTFKNLLIALSIAILIGAGYYWHFKLRKAK